MIKCNILSEAHRGYTWQRKLITPNICREGFVFPRSLKMPLYETDKFCYVTKEQKMSFLGGV